MVLSLHFRRNLRGFVLSALLTCAALLVFRGAWSASFGRAVDIEHASPLNVADIRRSSSQKRLGNQEFLDCLSRGHFVPRFKHVDDAERKKLDSALHEVWKAHNIPLHLSRQDGRCGNVSFPNHWARALCDPDGERPCCRDSVCTRGSVDECACDGCLDMRQRVQPELSDFVQGDDKCKMADLQQTDACGVLRGKNITTLVTLGDSLVRHLHVGFLILLKQDPEFGSLPNNSDIRGKCSGYRQFTEKWCRDQINYVDTVCGGSVRVIMAGEGYRSGLVQHSLKTLEAIPQNTLIISSIGLHDGMDPSPVIANHVRPILAKLHTMQRKHSAKQTTLWPMYIWMSQHLPGLLKGIKYANQMEAGTRKFDARMSEYFRLRDVLHFNTFELTRNVFSWDGTHYGSGFNTVLAQLFLTFIESLET